jgi:hypothetical protein
MENEEIKNELILRFEKVSQFSKSNKIEELKQFVESDILNILNEILKEKNIKFKDNEKSELVKYLKPTIIKLIVNYIKK